MSRPSRSVPWVAGAVALLLALFLAGTVHAEYLGNITFGHPSPSFLPNGLQVTVSVDYKIDDPAGRRIYVLPYTDGAPSPGYGVSGSPIYPAGTGTATNFFTILSGTVAIDEVRVYTRDPDFTVTPLEVFVPVIYRYGPHGLWNVQPDHSQHSHLRHGMQLSMTFDYEVDAPGCKIYARPFNSGHLEPGYFASGSADLPPSGSYSQDFYFNDDADMTHIRFQIFALDNTTLLQEIFVPWDCHWREWGVYDISLDWPDLTSLHNTQNLVSSFTVDHLDPAGLYAWMLLVKDGGLAVPQNYQGSVLLGAGTHAITRFARINAGTVQTDAVRFIIGQPGDSYLEFDVPRLIDYGPHALQNFAFTPAAPAILSNGEHLQMTFDYITDHGANVLIFGRPAYDGTPLFGMTSSGSPYYAPPSGSGSFWCTFASGNHLADSIRFQMVNADQSVVLLEHHAHGSWAWGTPATITPVAEAPPAALASLGHCYPNPFNPTTTIPVTLGRGMQVKLAVYDLRGHLVRTLQDGVLAAGEHAFTFDGKGLASGAYLCRLESPVGVATERLTLVK
ncbi:MAG TPA: T9SS type A sorting domain-containing protein [Candidatus Krumholzibacteria bacterium]|nr:T9SS type A sorting domain-containing protein [Candidatus Krumholzibacteria bacterium]HPD72400.1 T9SS type A sorting domain-containing protein [Candidatus Krumholzibacteria bacterium]HRY40668.1 T9SS type A sorting domain-containing protein [Candidatus Krumholzibacteria bacterium]